ncbi:MAG: D-alanine-D-alanine ligase [Clostridia bacterium]|nr:D-alanine-D-alanine ligase [Clostridia bacterium]
MLRILFLFNAVPGEKRRGPFSDCLSWQTVHRIYRALLEGGNEVYPLNARSSVQVEKSLLRLPQPHLAFVLAEGYLDEPVTLYDGSGAAAVRLLLQRHGIPASHSSVAAMEICRHKHLTYQVLQQAGLPVPPHRLLRPGRELLAQQLDEIEEEKGFPLFIKPDGGGNSIGVGPESVVFNLAQLADRVKALQAALGDLPVLVEKYLPGQEYTVGLIGCSPFYVLPALGFLSREVRTATIKGNPHEMEHIFPTDRRYYYFRELAGRVLEAIGGKDALRIDLRADSVGKIYIIDVNGTPSLSPLASLTTMALATGLSYSQFINCLLYQSLLEYGLPAGSKLQDLIAPALALLYPYRQDRHPSRVSTA